jgi:hypothetical protein
MTDLSGYREEQTLESMISGGAYVALHNGDEGNSPDGSQEVSAGDYDRVQVAEGDWSVSGEGPTTLENDNVIDFGTTSSDWGTITHASIWDGASDADNPQTSTIDVENAGDAPEGIQVEIPAGALTFEIN